MTYYLYVKTHNLTGLKYLGQTQNDPETYIGSGKIWLRHLRKHGKDVTTQVIGCYHSHDELKENGLYYSKLWNVVESTEWANLMNEAGDGSAKGRKDSAESRMKKRQYHLGRKRSEQQKRNMSLAQMGINRKGINKRPKTEAERLKMSLAKKGKPPPNKGVPMSEEQKQKLRVPKPKTHKCDHCQQMVDVANFTRWHGDKCKSLLLTNVVFRN